MKQRETHNVYNLPMHVCLSFQIYTTSAPWSTFDTVATAVAAIGALISFTADNQLRSFMVANERKLRKGEKLDLLLNTGLWRYSRHPNYFGGCLHHC